MQRPNFNIPVLSRQACLVLLAIATSFGSIVSVDSAAAADITLEDAQAHTFAETRARSAYVDTHGQMWVRQQGAVDQDWQKLTSNVASYQMLPDGIAILQRDGTLLWQDGNLHAPLRDIATNVATYQLIPYRLGYLQKDGRFAVAERNQPPMFLADNVRAFQLTKSRIALLDASDKLYLQENDLTVYPFRKIADNVKQFQLAREWVAYLQRTDGSAGNRLMLGRGSVYDISDHGWTEGDITFAEQADNLIDFEMQAEGKINDLASRLRLAVVDKSGELSTAIAQAEPSLMLDPWLDRSPSLKMTKTATPARFDQVHWFDGHLLATSKEGLAMVAPVASVKAAELKQLEPLAPRGRIRLVSTRMLAVQASDGWALLGTTNKADGEMTKGLHGAANMATTRQAFSSLSTSLHPVDRSFPAQARNITVASARNVAARRPASLGQLEKSGTANFVPHPSPEPRVNATLPGTAQNVPAAVSTPSDAVPLYQAWNANTTDHFYTTSHEDWRIVLGMGFDRQRGAAAMMEPDYRTGTTRFRRYFKYLPETDHFYTANAQEADLALQLGYTAEQYQGYIYTYPKPGTVPLYRLIYNGPSGDRDHFYTTWRGQARKFANSSWRWTWENNQRAIGWVWPVHKIRGNVGVGGVRVRARARDGSITKTAVSNNNGKYVIRNLPPGVYTVSIANRDRTYIPKFITVQLRRDDSRSHPGVNFSPARPLKQTTLAMGDVWLGSRLLEGDNPYHRVAQIVDVGNVSRVPRNGAQPYWFWYYRGMWNDDGRFPLGETPCAEPRGPIDDNLDPECDDVSGELHAGDPTVGDPSGEDFDTILVVTHRNKNDTGYCDGNWYDHHRRNRIGDYVPGYDRWETDTRAMAFYWKGNWFGYDVPGIELKFPNRKILHEDNGCTVDTRNYLMVGEVREEGWGLVPNHPNAASFNMDEGDGGGSWIAVAPENGSVWMSGPSGDDCSGSGRNKPCLANPAKIPTNLNYDGIVRDIGDQSGEWNASWWNSLDAATKSYLRYMTVPGALLSEYDPSLDWSVRAWLDGQVDENREGQAYVVDQDGNTALLPANEVKYSVAALRKVFMNGSINTFDVARETARRIARETGEPMVGIYLAQHVAYPYDENAVDSNYRAYKALRDALVYVRSIKHDKRPVTVISHSWSGHIVQEAVYDMPFVYHKAINPAQLPRSVAWDLWVDRLKRSKAKVNLIYGVDDPLATWGGGLCGPYPMCAAWNIEEEIANQANLAQTNIRYASHTVVSMLNHGGARWLKGVDLRP